MQCLHGRQRLYFPKQTVFGPSHCLKWTPEETELFSPPILGTFRLTNATCQNKASGHFGLDELLCGLQEQDDNPGIPLWKLIECQDITQWFILIWNRDVQLSAMFPLHLDTCQVNNNLAHHRVWSTDRCTLPSQDSSHRHRLSVAIFLTSASVLGGNSLSIVFIYHRIFVCLWDTESDLWHWDAQTLSDDKLQPAEIKEQFNHHHHRRELHCVFACDTSGRFVFSISCLICCGIDAVYDQNYFSCLYVMNGG